MELIRVQDSDTKKAYEMYMTFAKDENGYINPVYGYEYDEFLKWIDKKRDWSVGKNLPEGFVPDTTYILEDDGKYVGAFNLRHHLNDFLREGPGHIGYGISKEYRGKGYATKGLLLTLEKAKEHGIYEAYLSVNKDNPASLKVQKKCGAYIHHENDKEYFTRINLETKREEIVENYYKAYDEDSRLQRSCHGRLEYATTMHYIHKYAKEGAKILEVGAGTGRYSVALAKEGFDVTAVELTSANLEVLKKNGEGVKTLKALKGDATNLKDIEDGTFDVTVVLGPFYHLYERKDLDKAIKEALRVTKKDGIVMFAYISVYAIMYMNYFQGNWAFGEEENFTKDYKVKHYKEQVFTGFDVEEFSHLFDDKDIDYITTVSTDQCIGALEERSDFSLPDADFAAFFKWHLAICEKKELLGSGCHLLYICKKR